MEITATRLTKAGGTTAIWTRPRAWLGHPAVAGSLLAAAMLAVYLGTLAPGVFGFDSAEFATGVYTLGIVHPPGYPLYLLLGKLFTLLVPLGGVAFRINLMSALFGALAVLGVYALTWLTLKRVWMALAAAGLFAAGNYFWHVALVAEVYTLHALFLALNLLLLLQWRRTGDRRYLHAFALAYGLSLANHTSGILFAPGFAWMIATGKGWTWERGLLARLAGLFALGLAPYLYLPIRALANPSLNYVDAYYGVDLMTPGGLWWMVSGQAYRFFIFGYSPAQIPGEVARFLVYLWRNYLGIGVLLGVAGVWRLWRRERTLAAGLLLVFAANAVFFINYSVVDKDTMFVPAFLVWALFVGWGLRAAATGVRLLVRRGLALPALARASRAALIALPLLAVLVNWNWVDLSSSRGSQLFAEHVFRTAEPDALIIAPWSSAVVLEYYQLVEGYRPDLEIYNRSRFDVATYYQMWQAGKEADAIFHTLGAQTRRLIDEQISRRAIYLVQYDPLFANAYEYLPEGSYFKLKPVNALEYILRGTGEN
jgi:hypothetical protein